MTVVIPQYLVDYFDTLEKKEGIKLKDAQKRWYAHKYKELGEAIRQEYPSCISFDTPVITQKGIVSMESVDTDGVNILEKFYKGDKETFTLKTLMGYEVRCTNDHLLKTPSGFHKLEDLNIGDFVNLSYECQDETDKVLSLSTFSCCSHQIKVTEDLAKFAGYYLGDGSFYENALSFACNKIDDDVVQDILNLLERMFNVKAQTRLTGTKKGCCEVRVSRTGFKQLLLDLDLVEHRNSGGLKRKMHIPNWLLTSSLRIKSKFLQSYFESDGFVNRPGISVKVFCKHKEFLRNIQLILLQFGITSRRIEIKKYANDKKYPYVGYELSLRKEETWNFKQKIGFVSKRKSSRIKKIEKKSWHTNQLDMQMKDSILSIEPSGLCSVYDITTKKGEFSAGGITVHNCPDESFMGSTEGFWYLKELADIRENGQITNVLPQPQLLTHTAWDIGFGDNTSIWFYQLMPSGNVHIIDYYENSAEGLHHYVEVINEKRYTYGIHYLPHDAAAHEKGSGLSYETQARDLGLDVKVLMRYNPSKTTFQAEVQRVRNLLKRCWFDEARCAIGIKHLESYQKKWNESMGHYTSDPVHNIHSHAADSARYMAQAIETKARKATVDKMESERDYIRSARRRRI